MRKKTMLFILSGMTFILSGMTFIILLTVSVLVILSHYMDRQTLQDARLIAGTYLEGVAEEEIYNYLSIFDIRLTQIKNLEKKLDQEGEAATPQSIHDSILEMASSQDIKVCALIGPQGEIETEYGPQLVRVGNPTSLIEKLKLGESIVMTGASEEDDLIVWASPGRYPMSDGQESVGILCCRNIDQFIEKLHLDTDKGLANFFVIRRDGSYVVRTGQTTEDNYFERILAHGTPVGATSQEKVEALKSAIAHNETWAIEVTYADERYGIDERRSVRADPLPGSNWYLVSILPYGTLDHMIDNMSQARYTGMLVALILLISGIILVVLL